MSKKLQIKLEDIKKIFFEVCAKKAEVRSFFRFIYIKSFLDDRESNFS